MNDADLKVKQQIVDKIKSSTNILVTVSKDPTVDDLSAAIGLATLLNKLDKHATAIFSGAIPPAITFLSPDKVFENSADSLRDFIIALDKEKADHLRYKVEGDVVKIFITPYRTTISADDLEFSQGDFNVELVMALGVENQEHLDTALAAHGRILHDVTVATFSAGTQVSQLGSLDWHDDNASSLCEMVASVGEALKSDKPLLDKQIATALLTGIVASTERFSNTRTTARVMTMAADLMAAGADQQLIAAKLQESHEISSLPTSTINESTEAPVAAEAPAESGLAQSTLPPDGDLTIAHEADAPTEQSSESTIAPSDVSTLTEPAPFETSSLPAPVPTDNSMSTIAPAYAPPEPTQFTPEPTPFVLPTPEPEPTQNVVDVAPQADPTIEPLLGGILNATTDQAAEEARRELEDQQNKTILTHSYLGGSEPGGHNTPINGVGQTEDMNDVDIFATNATAGTAPTIDLPLPPPVMPDFSTLPPPPIPDFNMASSAPALDTTPAPAINDPSQFRIPGQ